MRIVNNIFRPSHRAPWYAALPVRVSSYGLVGSLGASDSRAPLPVLTQGMPENIRQDDGEGKQQCC